MVTLPSMFHFPVVFIPNGPMIAAFSVGATVVVIVVSITFQFLKKLFNSEISAPETVSQVAVVPLDFRNLSACPD